MENIKVVYKRIDLLKPYEGNARVHSEAQIKQIADSIREFGFVNPVLIDRDNVVVAGHGRLIAAASLGYEKVPTVQLGYLSDRQRRALSIADNRIALNGTWDLEKLTAELNALAEADFDLSLIGFDEQELDSLLRADAPIVANPDNTIVDGFHRWTVSGHREIYALTDGYVPVVFVQPKDEASQQMATIRHNRARGTHAVLRMADIVSGMVKDGLCMEEICHRLQMEEEEVVRLSNRAGIPKTDIVVNHSWSKSWVPE